MFPMVRTEGIWTEVVGDELVIYDRDAERSHRLNRSAAAVWRHCDGTKSAADMARLLREELTPAMDEELVQLALVGLGQANLLVQAVPQPDCSVRMTRRQAVRRLGTVGAMALLIPVVSSVVAPKPADAQSAACGCFTIPCVCPCGCLSE